VASEALLVSARFSVEKGTWPASPSAVAMAAVAHSPAATRGVAPLVWPPPAVAATATGSVAVAAAAAAHMTLASARMNAVSLVVPWKPVTAYMHYHEAAQVKSIDSVRRAAAAAAAADAAIAAAEVAPAAPTAVSACASTLATWTCKLAGAQGAEIGATAVAAVAAAAAAGGAVASTAGSAGSAAAAAAAAATVNAQCDKSVKLYHTKHSCDGLLFQLAVSVATAFILPSNRCIDGKLWTLSNLDSRSSQAPKVCLFDSVRLDCGWCMLYRWEIVDTIQF